MRRRTAAFTCRFVGRTGCNEQGAGSRPETGAHRACEPGVGRREQNESAPTESRANGMFTGCE